MEIVKMNKKNALWRIIDNYLPSIQKVAPEDIQRVAKKYLIEDNRTVGILIPLPLRERVHGRPELHEQSVGIEVPLRPESFRDELSNISPPSRVEDSPGRGGDEGEGVGNNHYKTPPP